ncbi:MULTISPECIES: LuxR C-terminal-related transcriptional regulator [Geobacillus]|uniref:LuxR C-terminal-related transcriptional regulator n=1 Tax=Geobacillus TaxID=129337 RepID=UPI000AD97B5B|nr:MULTISPECIES: LuxR C-terminal-related transcriptional regulator [Geobacillus]
MKEEKPTITEIECKIIKMIASEIPNKQIASELNYSQRMIEYYITVDEQIR